jgi:hypothetical protein
MRQDTKARFKTVTFLFFYFNCILAQTFLQAFAGPLCDDADHKITITAVDHLIFFKCKFSIFAGEDSDEDTALAGKSHERRPTSTSRQSQRSEEARVGFRKVRISPLRLLQLGVIDLI